jgi:hypothetical protein
MTNSLLERENAHEREWIKKYNDVNKKGITSVYWNEILDIIKYLESKEEYEKCQDLWEYYQSITGH